MIKKSIEIGLEEGLSPRPVAEIVSLAGGYSSSIYIEADTKRVNAKSIMGMMSLSMLKGESLTVTADGSDEEAAVSVIEDYISGKKAG